ncbi:MAG: SPOR domain-containing protein [Nitrospirae bacterium]|nr:SPOR domain-containing protein [Magnetococcales bacterium]
MGFPAARRSEVSALVRGLVMVFLAQAVPVLAAGGPGNISTDAAPEQKPLREFIYYPNYAQSPYHYQSTGDFYATPMVIPSSVPVVRQPSQIIVQAPPLQPLPLEGFGPPQPVVAQQSVVQSPPHAAPGQVPAKGFSLHVGSFMDSANADLLLQQVTSAGVPAYRRPMSYNGTVWEQIHAGPFDNHEQVTQISKVLQDRLQIQGRVVTH